MLKVTLKLPAATGTEAGGVKAELLLLMATENALPEGALFKPTVQVVLPP